MSLTNYACLVDAPGPSNSRIGAPCGLCRTVSYVKDGRDGHNILNIAIILILTIYCTI